jgi:hypothetical protein
MNSSKKPLTFAAMLVRAQRRFEAMGKPFPSSLAQQKHTAVQRRPAQLAPAAA